MTQPSLFDHNYTAPIAQPTATENSAIDLYWRGFLPTVQKLHEEKRTGKNTTGAYYCQEWWRSRFSDYLTNTNAAPKTHDEWVWRKIGHALFNDMYAKYYQQLNDFQNGK